MNADSDALDRLITEALKEDLGGGDITSEAVIPPGTELAARLTTREDIVVAGLDFALAVFRRQASEARIETHVEDGARAQAGAVLAHIKGNAHGILAAERTALNLLQHLSGIATLTRRYVDALEGTGVVLMDTRKTIPGLRRLEKYATQAGGAQNHRMGLYDGILIKDNHIALAGGVAQAVRRAKEKGCDNIEVECDTLKQAEEALAAAADRLLLDNMDTGTLKRAVALANGRAKLEASGGVTLETIRAIAETGVDCISAGRITLSAPAVDIGLDYET